MKWLFYFYVLIVGSQIDWWDPFTRLHFQRIQSTLRLNEKTRNLQVPISTCTVKI
jgi:hypothetical protein